MTTISIKEFAGYDRKTFDEFVDIHKDSKFVIQVPKETSIYEDDALSITQEYMDQFYIAHQLREVLNEFEYYLPALNQKSNFGYLGFVSDVERFKELVYGFIETWQEEDKRIDLHVASAVYFEQDFEQIHCYELYIIADQFMMILDTGEGLD